MEYTMIYGFGYNLSKKHTLLFIDERFEIFKRILSPRYIWQPLDCKLRTINPQFEESLASEDDIPNPANSVLYPIQTLWE